MQLIFAVGLIALFALGATWWNAKSTSRVPMLAAAVAMQPGHVVTQADLTTIFVNVDRPEFARLIPEADGPGYVGSVSLVPIERGQFMTPLLFAFAEPLAEDEAFVGLVLGANAHPGSLQLGDRVIASSTDDTGETSDVEASVEQLVDLGDGSVTVRLRVAKSDSVELQQRSSQNSVVVVEIFEDDVE